ncbi:MAG: alginate O-acetyltransferase complex protein AlgI [Crocinitomicaceae bacterium]
MLTGIAEMLFNSTDFFVFFFAVFALYWIIDQRYRWILLLAASYFFYMSWEPVYLVLILFSTAVDYFACNYLTSSASDRKRKLGLFISVVTNLGLLFTFKYYDFFQETIVELAHSMDIEYIPSTSSLLLPVGISFYTFQTLSYSIDVYRKTINAERHLGKFALYVSFFPQLVAGPIERAKDLLPQMHRKGLKLSHQAFREGSLLFAWGLFKKIVVADNCAMLVEAHYDSYELHSGGSLLFVTYLFAIQIYCDFSGYSDMAIGIAKLLGFELKQNFKTPYFSSSFTKFWRRWHISLSSWMRDYIYVPLGGNKSGSKLKQSGNLMATMGIGGLWHGPSLNFILWGLVNGIMLVLEKIIGFRKGPIPFWRRLLGAFVVLNVISLTWVFFRADSFDQAMSIFGKIFTMHPSELYVMLGEYKYSPAIIGALLLIIFEIQHPFSSILKLLDRKPIWRYSHYLVLVFALLLLGNTVGVPFIYFQF